MKGRSELVAILLCCCTSMAASVHDTQHYPILEADALQTGNFIVATFCNRVTPKGKIPVTVAYLR